LQYQWRFNGADIPGATNSSYTLLNGSGANAGNYSVAVNNAVGNVVSADAALTVNVNVSITQQPQGQSAGVGSTVTFAVSAAGTGPLRYQWQFNGADLGGRTNSTLVLTNVQTGSAGSYQVIVSNSFSFIVSTQVALTTVSLPVILQHPSSQTVLSGPAVAFDVVATGTGVSYQWTHNGLNIPGATNATLNLSSAQYVDRGSYQAVVANLAGSVFSAPATLSIVPSDTRILSLTPTNGGFRILMVGVGGKTFALQATTDMAHWTTLTNFTFVNDTFEFVDADAANFEKRFYRAINFAGPRFLSQTPTNGALRMTLVGDVGKTFVLQASTNLVDWTSLTTFTFAGITFDFVDAQFSNYAQRFYRAISLSGPRFSSQNATGGGFIVSLSGINGLSFDLQSSTNLVDWSALTNFTFGTGPFQFTDPAPPDPHRFYRAVKNP
jgi:hypothetical protein